MPATRPRAAAGALTTTRKPYNVNAARAARHEAEGHEPWPFEINGEPYTLPAELPVDLTEWAAAVQQSGNVRALVINLLIAAEHDTPSLRGQSQRFEKLRLSLPDVLDLLKAYLDEHGVDLGESLPSLH